jgi:hypothetical protein
VAGAFQAPAADVGDHGVAGLGPEEPGEVVVGDPGGAGDDRHGEVGLDVGHRGGHHGVRLPGTAEGRQAGHVPPA